MRCMICINLWLQVECTSSDFELLSERDQTRGIRQEI